MSERHGESEGCFRMIWDEVPWSVAGGSSTCAHVNDEVQRECRYASAAKPFLGLFLGA